MNLRRILIGCAGAVVLSPWLCPQAMGETVPYVSVERAREGDGDIELYLHGSWPEEEKPGPEVFSVHMGNQELAVKGAESYEETGEGTSYLFLMDVSGSIPAHKLDEMKKFLGAMAGYMKDTDSACLVALGNDMYSGEFAMGGKALKEQAERTERLHEDTNLYYGIVESLKRLENTEGLHRRRVLVILSDGEDDQATGITREEAQNAVRETRVPVYTVAFLKDNAGQRQMDMAKLLGSFARMSPGGVHTALGVENVTWEMAAGRVRDAVGRTLVLTVETDGYRPDTGQAYLEVAYAVNGGYGVSDGYMETESKLGLGGGNSGAPGHKAVSDETVSDETVSDETVSGKIVSDETVSDETVDGALGSGLATPAGTAGSGDGGNQGSEPEDSGKRSTDGLRPYILAAGAVAVMALAMAAVLKRVKSPDSKEEFADLRQLAEPAEDIARPAEDGGGPAEDIARSRKNGGGRAEVIAQPRENGGERAEDIAWPPENGGEPGEDLAPSREHGDGPAGEEIPGDLSGETPESGQFPEKSGAVHGNVGWLHPGLEFNREETGYEGPGGSGASDGAVIPSILVYLTKVGLKEDETAALTVCGRITLGRSPQRSRAVLSGDRQVSGLHCSISYDGRNLILRDEGSKNGTYVNGVPISEPYSLSRDDVIGLGTGSYRIHWSEMNVDAE